MFRFLKSGIALLFLKAFRKPIVETYCTFHSLRHAILLIILTARYQKKGMAFEDALEASYRVNLRIHSKEIRKLDERNKVLQAQLDRLRQIEKILKREGGLPPGEYRVRF